MLLYYLSLEFSLKEWILSAELNSPNYKDRVPVCRREKKKWKADSTIVECKIYKKTTRKIYDLYIDICIYYR